MQIHPAVTLTHYGLQYGLSWLSWSRLKLYSNIFNICFEGIHLVGVSEGKPTKGDVTLTINLEKNISSITCTFSHRDHFSGGKDMKKMTVKSFPVTFPLLILPCTKPTFIYFSLCLCVYLTMCKPNVISAGFVLGFFACLLSKTNGPPESSSSAMKM